MPRVKLIVHRAVKSEILQLKIWRWLFWGAAVFAAYVGNSDPWLLVFLCVAGLGLGLLFGLSEIAQSELLDKE